jgi:hypothetical protein
MEEGIFDVELMDRLVLGEGEGEDDANGGELDDGAVVVYFGALGEAPKDPTDLVVVEGGIRSQLVAKEPIAGDHIGAWRTRHEVPGVVGQQGCVLLHSPTPLWISEGSVYGGGDRGGVRWSSGRISGQNPLVDGPKDCVDVPGVAFNGDRVVHRRLRAVHQWPTRGVINDGRVGESGRARRGARVRGHRGRGAPATVVNEGGVGEASHAHRRGRTWRGHD